MRLLVPDLHYLRLTKDGHPGHPLYLPADLKPRQDLQVKATRPDGSVKQFTVLCRVDTPGEADFYELIAQVHQRRGLTVVLVSHDLSMVYRHASRVYALNGVICCEGAPEEVMNAESLKQAYGIHFTPYHHHHHSHPHGGHGH